MKKLLLVILASAMVAPVPATARKKKTAKGVDTALVAKLKTDDWTRTLKGARRMDGMFPVYLNQKDGKLYFELDEQALKHPYILSNRIAQTSNTHDYVAGQMVDRPQLVRFSRDSVKVMLHLVQQGNVVGKDDPIAASFRTNFADPVLKGFKIAAQRGGRVLIDVTSFFGSNEKSLSPIKPDNPLSVLFGGSKGLKGSYQSDASGISEVKNFPLNIEIKTLLTFSLSSNDKPYSVVMHRSLYRAPDTLMRARLHDRRVGYFSTDQKVYSSQADRVDERSIIHRWRIEPRDSDRQKYFAGELVEPKKPIVFYVDSAFPEKWRSTVKQGILDWNAAFEAAGFKNVVQVRDYPKNDPAFDPDDMRYSCVKYAVTETANAMGPSYVDPRTGEILTADVIWYHNVISLLHNWRFVQTGAVDYRTHKKTFDDEVMKESMRYVTSHEIGHTLGLMHNMGASFAFPVDSLRSPSFTQKYGTTPSIMDYARNNFIAQPGDMERGVKLTPPILGVEDINAIKWGYRLIKGAQTMDDEKPVLSQWIREKAGDAMYEFGPQQVMGTVDVSAQTEDLGNDHVKAGNYAISNLKIIMRNLEKWTAERDADYSYMQDMYKSLVSQYARHLGHVLPYIGGVRYHEVRQGDTFPAVEYVDKAGMRRAMTWLVAQARSYKSWLCPQKLLMKFDRADEIRTNFENTVVSGLFASTRLQRIDDGHKLNAQRNYSVTNYVDDAFNEVFKPTIQGRSLTDADLKLASEAVALFARASGIQADGTKASLVKLADNGDTYYNNSTGMEQRDLLPCEYTDPETSFVRINYGLPSLPDEVYKPLMLRQLRRALSLFTAKRATGNAATKAFYEYQILTINKLLKK